MTEHVCSATLQSEEEDNSELVPCSKKIAKVKKYRPFTRKYNPQYLEYGFDSGEDVTNPEPIIGPIVCNWR